MFINYFPCFYGHQMFILARPTFVYHPLEHQLISIHAFLLEKQQQ